MSRFAQGKFNCKNPAKYIGGKVPTYRSGWEFAFMKFCDENVNVTQWASEAIRIPYRNPLTGKHTIYVPDFFIAYADKTGKQFVELIEVKPSSQTSLQEAGRSRHNQLHAVVNAAKWEAANAYCKQNKIKFRIVTEHDIFHGSRR
jgi:hypothetical protein